MFCVSQPLKGNVVSKPTMPNSTGESDVRTIWIRRDGQFADAGNGIWVETNNTKTDRAEFKEVKRNADFVEFADASRPMFIRLFPTNAIFSSAGDNGQWNQLYEGSWNKVGLGNGSEDREQVWTGKFRSFNTVLSGKLVIGVGATEDPLAIDVDDNLAVAVVMSGDETRQQTAINAFRNLENGSQVTVKMSQGKVSSITIMKY